MPTTWRRSHTSLVDRFAAEEWIQACVTPTGPLVLTDEHPWSTVLRIPLANGVGWFKECGKLQAFEPRLTAELFSRWPDRVPEVLAVDETRGWLLLADAGTRIGDLGNPPEYWVEILPLYAELQRQEANRAFDHLARGVPDLRVQSLPAHYDELVQLDLPLSNDDRRKLRGFSPCFEQLCTELSSESVPESVQHDDLHMNNVYVKGDRLRVLDWGDSSISHPFASLVATFRFLKEGNGITDGDSWHARIRDAYLEPWGSGLTDVFDLAQRVGKIAHAIAAIRQRSEMRGAARERFDQDLAIRLQLAAASAIR
jgi:phosphotransferase family enzyme